MKYIFPPPPKNITYDIFWYFILYHFNVKKTLTWGSMHISKKFITVFYTVSKEQGLK